MRNKTVNMVGMSEKKPKKSRVMRTVDTKGQQQGTMGHITKVSVQRSDK